MVEQKASYFKDHSLEEAYLSHLPGGRMDEVEGGSFRIRNFVIRVSRVDII